MRLYFFSLLIFLFNIVSAYGQSSEEYVISPCVITQDCVGAYNKDDFNFLMDVILAKDKEAYLKMILEGRVYFFKKGQRVYLQRVHWSGVDEVRPEGETYIVWVNSSFVDCSGRIPLESYQSENNKKQAEYKPETSKLILTEIAHVYLKNGNVLEGKIAKETERGIYLEILNGKGKIFVRHSEIEKVERSRVISDRNKKDCYNLGYRWGRCATLAFFGYECPPEDNFVMPKECVDKEATKKGIEAGVKSVWKKLGLLDYKDYKDKNSSRDHYDKALDYFSEANFYYEEGILSKAYRYYEEAERQAQYSRESEDLNSYEDKMMLDIIQKCREGTSKIADKKRKFQSLIWNHKIAKGMTMEEVRKSWGSPASVSKYGNTVSWTFGDCLYGCTIVYFEDDHVVDWSKW